jgi:hypothetical protein
MENPTLLLYQPKQQPGGLLHVLKQKLTSLEVPLQVYFCMAALKTHSKIEEKKAIGVHFLTQLSKSQLEALQKITDDLMSQNKDLVFIQHNDSNFKTHFEQEGPVFSI